MGVSRSAVWKESARLGRRPPWALQVAQVAVDEHALEFRPAEHVEAVRSVRLESKRKHVDEVAGWRGRPVCPIVLRSGLAAHVHKCPDVELP